MFFVNFSKLSQPYHEAPKKRRAWAWDSNPRTTSAVLSRAFTSGATTRPQPRLRVKGVHIAVMCGRTPPGRHAEGKCIKNLIKIDYFSSKCQAISIKFMIQKSNPPQVRATKTMLKSRIFHQNSNRYLYTTRRR